MCFLSVATLAAFPHPVLPEPRLLVGPHAWEGEGRSGRREHGGLASVCVGTRSRPDGRLFSFRVTHGGRVRSQLRLVLVAGSSGKYRVSLSLSFFIRKALPLWPNEAVMR